MPLLKRNSPQQYIEKMLLQYGRIKPWAINERDNVLVVNLKHNIINTTLLKKLASSKYPVGITSENGDLTLTVLVK